MKTWTRRGFAQLLPAGGLLMAGCSGILPKPPPQAQRYTLDDGAGLQVAPPGAAGRPVLLVALPSAAPGYESQDMVYRRGAGPLQAYAQHGWVDAPARMLAPLWVRALQASGSYRAVLMAPSAAAAGLRLETELLRLSQDYGPGASQLRLSVRAVLVDTATRGVVGSLDFDEREPCAAEDAAAGAAAAQRVAWRVAGLLAAACTRWTAAR